MSLALPPEEHVCQICVIYAVERCVMVWPPAAQNFVFEHSNNPLTQSACLPLLGTQQVNGEVVQLTNAEWIDLIYPTNEHLPYMYDEYSWSHCT